MFKTTYVYMFTYIHVKTINKKRGHEFIGKKGGTYGRIWGKEWDGKNDVTIFSKIKEIIKFSL